MQRDGKRDRAGRSGPGFVLGLYLALVCVGGVAGFLTATVVENVSPPAYLFLIEFPPTQFGFAAYGALTVATVLGVPLVLVVLVSQHVGRAE